MRLTAAIIFVGSFEVFVIVLMIARYSFNHPLIEPFL